MENRFGVKDFILYLLVAALIVMVVLAMFQYDRQWGQMQLISAKLEDQARDLRTIQSTLASGAALARPTGMEQGTTQPATAAASNNDPFARILAARALPGYAPGDWLVDGFGGGVAKLTPLLSGDASAADVQGEVLESLATRDPVTLDWKPLLAQSWTIDDNSNAYDAYVRKMKAKGATDEQMAKDAHRPPAIVISFRLRDNTHFSDGEPLSADDVVFTYDFIMNEKIAAPRDRAFIQRIKKVHKKGPYEVVFTFDEPYFQAFELAASMGILPKHFYGKFAAEEFNQSVGLLLGSGPYRMENPTAWKPGTLIQLVRNDRYWGVAPAFDRLVYREITNDKARQIAFRNGEIDQFPAFPEQYQEMLADAPLAKRTQHYDYQNPIGGYRYVAWNEKLNGQPTQFADKRVRQALTMLIDRQRMIDDVMLGYAVIATGPFNPQSKQYNPAVKPWPYDVQRAKSLLAEAGFRQVNADGVLTGPDGKPFQFKLTYPSGNPNYEKMALFLKDAFAEAGIVLNPDPLEWAIFTDRLSNKNFQAISLAWTAGIENDVFQMFHSSQMVEGGDDFISYKNEELDRLIDQARRTVKEEERMPIWQKVHLILHEDQPYTFLFFPKSLRFMDARIHNVQLLKLGLNPLEEWFVPRAEQRYRQ